MASRDEPGNFAGESYRWRWPIDPNWLDYASTKGVKRSALNGTCTFRVSEMSN